MNRNGFVRVSYDHEIELSDNTKLYCIFCLINITISRNRMPSFN